jgi:D-alanyl-D-alanine carboxypeptidase/D-alanyl-D-alanine-endopeptidase (penicillin-binding protein 4)
VYPFDGAGSNDQCRSSVRALATFYKNVLGEPYAPAFVDSLPILGQDGTLGNVLVGSPAAGKARMKTGNRGVGTRAGQMILLGNSLAGYVEAKSGRPIVVVVAMGNMPFDSFPEFVAVTQDQAKMVELMQQAF